MMIDLKKVREDIAGYKLICQKKGKHFDIDAILALDDKRKALQLEIDQTKAQQKQLATQKDYEGAKNLKIQIQELETQHTQVDAELKSWLLKMPNTALHPEVPEGKDDSENVVVQNF